MRKETVQYGKEKERGMEVGEEENVRKDSTMKSSFIHTVSSYVITNVNI